MRIRMRLPSLRERADDIPLLARHFLALSARQLGAYFAQLHREASTMNRATPWSWTLLMRASGKPMLNTLLPWGAALPCAMDTAPRP